MDPKHPAPPLDDAEETALAALYERALRHEKAGEAAEAAALYRQMLTLDPADRAGASVRLAALAAGDAPAIAPPAYVSLLFDQHAEVFDGMLVDQLGYDAPLRIREALAPHAPLGRVLDLGCGTGLVGEALRDMAGRLVGVDLSEGMLDVAHEKEVYDALYIADAAAFLAPEQSGDAPAEADPDACGPWDVIAAADVLPYLGDLTALTAGFAAELAPDGIVAFTTETAPDAAFDGRDYMVGPKHRFAHRDGYLHATLSAAGLRAREMTPIVVRYDEGEPVPGHLVIAGRL